VGLRLYMVTTSTACRPIRLLGLHVDRGHHEHKHGRRVRCIGLNVDDAGRCGI